MLWYLQGRLGGETPSQGCEDKKGTLEVKKMTVNWFYIKEETLLMRGETSLDFSCRAEKTIGHFFQNDY